MGLKEKVNHKVEEIIKRNKFREAMKDKYDDQFDLSNKKDGHKMHLAAEYVANQKVRLLDEGAVVNGNGSIRFFIEKGAIQRFYDGLSADYVGLINLGHMEHSEYPIPIGEWTKDDLTIVDIGNGRKALDVDVRLYEHLYVVKDLRASNTVGVSVEMDVKIDFEKSEEMGFEVVSDININDYAIVGDCGNVRSFGLELSEGGNNNLKLKDWKKFFKEEATNLANEEAEETAEEVEEEAGEESEEAEEAEEEAADIVPAEEYEQLKADYEEAIKLFDKLDDLYSAVLKENEEIKAELAAKSKQNERLANDTISKTKKRLAQMQKDKDKKKEKNSESKYLNNVWGDTF